MLWLHIIHAVYRCIAFSIPVSDLESQWYRSCQKSQIVSSLVLDVFFQRPFSWRDESSLPFPRPHSLVHNTVCPYWSAYHILCSYSLVCNFRNMLLVQRQRCVSYLCCRSSVKTSVHCNLKNAIQVKMVPVPVCFFSTIATEMKLLLSHAVEP